MNGMSPQRIAAFGVIALFLLLLVVFSNPKTTPETNYSPVKSVPKTKTPATSNQGLPVVSSGSNKGLLSGLNENGRNSLVALLNGIDAVIPLPFLSQRRALFLNVLRSIKVPPPALTNWKDPKIGVKLSIAFIEPADSELSIHTLNSIAHVYGVTDAPLYVFHTKENLRRLQSDLSTWKGVVYVEMPNPNGASDIDLVNNLLGSEAFYKEFKTEFVLTVQPETIIKRVIPSTYFNYDFVGAPWHPEIAKLGGKAASVHINEDTRVGHGGFALRKVAAMLPLTKLPLPAGWDKRWEDQLIALNLAKNRVPSIQEAQEFASHSMSAENPVALHRPYAFKTISTKDLISMLANVPGSFY